ncbi:hypothetical protein [Cystobacter ferrugineus]|uniref:Uncharacterized protein n=1 Tax=Cystobacter ferrugineus TaxID=83449 RepID=A0A1L9B662_9BACT|nr:hypothetical protein [Cystobacter ferrugineus]OJH37745.1 hypothetical protein BON30_26530 [Cystobacter ferrugineus]
MPRLFFLWCLLFIPLGCEASRQEWLGLYEMTGIVHYSIPGLGHLSSPVLATWRVSEGTAVELLLSDVAGGCSLSAHVEEGRALLEPGTSCSWSENGVLFSLSAVRGSVVLADGQGRFEMAGRVTATTRGQLYPGEFIQNATLTRVGP